MTAIAHGKAAHAGNAHKEGANAIWAIARFVDAVQRLTDYDRGVTVNVGRVSGRPQQEHRARPRRGAARISASARRADGEALVEACARRRRRRRRASPGRASSSTAASRATRSSARRRARAARASTPRARGPHGLGGDEAPLIGGGSDASTSSGLGIPSIDGMGPRGSGFHTKDELIEVATLVPKAQALARFLAGRAQP